jgi:hypothetical protein
MTRVLITSAAYGGLNVGDDASHPGSPERADCQATSAGSA